jgi:chaperonin GroES
MMKIKPLCDGVIVRMIAPEETRKSGIIIPDTAKERPMEGVVIAVGPGKVSDSGERIEMDVKVDDIILFGKYAGTIIQLESIDYLMLHADDIMAIIG